MLEFIKIQQPSQVADYVSAILKKQLDQGNKVLWLLSGGSALKIEANIIINLANLSSNKLHRLSVSMVDERYGTPGHPDSNERQLSELVTPPEGLNFYSILNGKTIKDEALVYENWLSKELKDSNYRIILAGMGSDGHTFGVLPKSKAVRSNKLVEYYEGGGYSRITSCFKLLPLVDEVVLFAMGTEKKAQLQALESEKKVLDQPAQALKKAKKLTIFNDQVGVNYENWL